MNFSFQYQPGRKKNTNIQSTRRLYTKRTSKKKNKEELLDVHDKTTVKNKRGPRNRLGQEIGVLELRCYMQDPKLLPRYPFPDEVVTNVDVLRVGGSGRVVSQVQRPHVILVDNGTTGTLKWKYKTPQIAQENRFLEPVTHRNILRLTRRKRDTLLRPRQFETAPPAHITTAPETDLRPVSLLAKSESTKISNPGPIAAPRWYVIPRSTVDRTYCKM